MPIHTGLWKVGNKVYKNLLLTNIKQRACVFRNFLKPAEQMNSQINRGMELGIVVQELNKFADLRLAESWDNVGLLVEPTEELLVNNIMLTNDLTEVVLDEAIKKSINLILSYHPPIFSALKRITNTTWKVIIICFNHSI